MTQDFTDEAAQEEAAQVTLHALTNEVDHAHRGAFRLGARVAEHDVGLRGLYDPEAQAFLRQYELDAIQGITRDTARLIKQRLDRGIARGASARVVARDLREVVSAREGRLRAIARTELNRAANGGRYHGWKKSGRVREKEWISTHDDRVRADHLAADGEVVSIDEPFTRGAAAGHQYPPCAPNCRCTVAARTSLSFTAAAVRGEIVGLRAMEEAHVVRMARIWRAWPTVLVRRVPEFSVQVVTRSVPHGVRV